MKLVHQSNGHIVTATQKLTVSQVLSYFATTLKQNNNYLPLVRKYILFCLDNNYPFDTISCDLYISQHSGQLWPSQKSPIRRFVRFAINHGIDHVCPDPVAYSLPPAANELVLSFLSDAKNLTDGSKDTYLRSLNDFFYFLEHHSPSTSRHFDAGTGTGFSGKTVARYVCWLRKDAPDRPACSPFTVSLRLSVVKQLACWIIVHRHKISYSLSSEQLDALRDVSTVRGPKLNTEFHKDGLTEMQRDHLFTVIDDPKWAAIAALLSFEGLRTVEVSRLQYKDVDFTDMKLWVLGKGKDVKVSIRLFKTCARYLKAYINSLPSKDRQLLSSVRSATSSYLFAGIKTHHIRYHVNKYLVASGLKANRISAHSLRHTAAQILIAKGVDPVYVQQHLRHKDFSTTQIYVTQQTRKEYFSHLPDDV